jgi:ABC-type oligopeptide transport system substrate-binding subunit
MVLFNSRSGPLARNPALRRALAGVVRARDLVWRTLGRFAEPAVCLIPPGMLGHDPGRRSHPLDRDEAIERLRAAQIEPPVRLKAAVHPLFQDRYGSLFSALSALWSELGVKVQIATSSMAEFLESYQHNDGFDLVIGRWNADYDDPDNFTHTLFHSQTGLWRKWYSTAEADQVSRTRGRPAVRRPCIGGSRACLRNRTPGPSLPRHRLSRGQPEDPGAQAPGHGSLVELRRARQGRSGRDGP